MILITMEERDALLQRFPGVHIARTMKQRSRRHRYYCEETRAVMSFLNNIRTDPRRAVPDERKDVHNADGKKRRREQI